MLISLTHANHTETHARAHARTHTRARARTRTHARAHVHARPLAHTQVGRLSDGTAAERGYIIVSAARPAGWVINRLVRRPAGRVINRFVRRPAGRPGI